VELRLKLCDSTGILLRRSWTYTIVSAPAGGGGTAVDPISATQGGSSSIVVRWPRADGRKRVAGECVRWRSR
jgi:hypothetical protein